MKRVFTSFRVEDEPRVNGLRLLVANPEFYDKSVRTPYDSTDPNYIRRRFSALTYTSQWVAWEPEESIDKGNDMMCMGFYPMGRVTYGCLSQRGGSIFPGIGGTLTTFNG